MGISTRCSIRNLFAVSAAVQSLSLRCNQGEKFGGLPGESRLGNRIKEIHQFRERKMAPSPGPLTLLHDNRKQTAAAPC
jgi:hypothetical protein